MSPSRLIPLFAALLILGVSLPSSAAADNTMVLRADGSIVVGGYSAQAAPYCELQESASVDRPCKPRLVYWPTLVALGPSGAADPTFGAGGALVDFRSGGLYTATPKTVVAAGPEGGVYASSSAFDVSRVASLLSEGDPDVDYGERGIAQVDFSEVGEHGAVTPSALLPQADGSVIAGVDLATTVPRGPILGSSLAVEFGPTGGGASVIGSLGTNTAVAPGNVVAPHQSDLLRLADGSLVMTGRLSAGAGERAMLARLVGGSLDPAFGGGAGVVSFPAGSQDPAARGEAVVVDPQGRLVVAGSESSRPLVARFGADGRAEEGFGEKGMANPAVPGSLRAEATALAVQADGKIVIAGRSLDACPLGGCWRALVGRLNSDGTVDEGFGSGGFSRFALLPEDLDPGAIAVVIQPDGKILVSASPKYATQPFTVARFGPGGGLDPGFGAGGVASATPCSGTASQRRRAGCISAGVASVHAVLSRRPAVTLHVRPDNRLDPMVSVRLILPRALRLRPAIAKQRIRVLAFEGDAGRRVKRVPKVWPRRVSVRGIGSPDRLVVRLLGGAIAPTRRFAPGHKLVFRVEVKFMDGNSQTLRVRAG